MTREEEIRQASIEYTYKNRPMCIGGGVFSEVMDEMNRNHAFEEGAKWADARPNKKLVYTKQELMDMGFGFDLNGNIETIQAIDERTKKYINYRNDKWVEKACEWLSKTLYIHTEAIEDKHWNETKTFDWVTSDYDSVSDFIDGFRKSMED